MSMKNDKIIYLAEKISFINIINLLSLLHQCNLKVCSSFGRLINTQQYLFISTTSATKVILTPAISMNIIPPNIPYCYCGDFVMRYFNSTQLPLTGKAFNDAEKLVSRHFRISEAELKKNKYDVKTLAYLEQHEIKEGAFAHLCKYAYEKSDGLAEKKNKEGFDFYRICLQDNIILDAVERANPFIKFSPLMLYIAVHELIHVLRFGSGQIDFDASREKKEQEEIIVHNLTKTALQPVKHHDLDIVLDCFSSSFKICDIYN